MRSKTLSQGLPNLSSEPIGEWRVSKSREVNQWSLPSPFMLGLAQHKSVFMAKTFIKRDTDSDTDLQIQISILQVQIHVSASNYKLWSVNQEWSRSSIKHLKFRVTYLGHLTIVDSSKKIRNYSKILEMLRNYQLMLQKFMS